MFGRPRLHITGCIVHGYFMLFAVSDADCKKSGSTTVEILALCLEKLVDLGVDLASHHIALQLDNAGSQNKNNIVLGFLSCLVQSGILSGATVNFLRTGHTHEDIDMVFSLLASWMWKVLLLATVTYFVASIKTWLQQIKRPHEPHRFVVKLDQIHDWKTWLGKLGRHIVGLGGPSAPHVFELVRRNGTRIHDCVCTTSN